MASVYVEIPQRIEHFLYVEDLELAVYTALIVSAIMFFYGIYRYWSRWFSGASLPRIDNLSERVRRLISYSLLQRRVLNDRYAGTIHVMIFVGTLLLLAATLLRALEYDVFVRLQGTYILTGSVYLAFKLMGNVGGILLLAGLILAIVRRATGATKDLPNYLSDYLILLLLLVIVVTGFILDGIATLTYREGWVDWWDPVGMLIASAFRGVGGESLSQTYRILWLIHLTLALGGIAALPYTKLSHIIFGGVFNTFFSRLEPPSAFKPIPDIDRVVEEGGELGVQKLASTTWKERMDYDSCVRCARCHNQCPANLSGKPLSPMNLVLKFRELMDRGAWDEAVAPDNVSPDVIWSCVTCGACVSECPMLIHHVETILDVRRALFASGENTPNELLQVSYNMMRTGNPYGFNPADRESWLEGLAEKGIVEVAEEGEEYDYIYWTGCNVGYDPNVRGVGEALLKVLKSAGLRVAVILEEQCCGEPARRVGDELMFTEILKSNAETLSKYKFKALIVTCPHCYNAFKHEYPLYGHEIRVIHHTQLLHGLISEGKIRPGRLEVDVTYHDPCYLGRWNGVYEEPRNILQNIQGTRITEMQHNKNKSLCCGGGGGHAFYELKIGERISKLRIEEARGAGAKIVAVACPFCNVMLRSEAVNYDMEVRDVVELLAESMGLHGAED